MPKMIFVNLPVADLPAATAFYEAIGATRNPQFSGPTASCMVLSDTIHVMLLTHEFFATFTNRPIADAHAATGMLLCISQDSRAGVDAITDQALAAGGKEPRAPQDHGFMYGRSFEDLDGHIWEPMWMDVEAAARAMAQPQAADA